MLKYKLSESPITEHADITNPQITLSMFEEEESLKAGITKKESGGESRFSHAGTFELKSVLILPNTASRGDDFCH
jgi:hypothetical protein